MTAVARAGRVLGGTASCGSRVALVPFGSGVPLVPRAGRVLGGTASCGSRVALGSRVPLVPQRSSTAVTRA